MTLLSAGIVTEDTEAPTTPTNLAVSNTTETSTDLSWDASSDDEGVAGYYVYQDGVQVQDVSGASTTTTTVSGLSSDTTYSFAVSAYDAGGNESTQSASVQVTTGAAVPQDGLEAWWTMDTTDVSGGEVADKSGNGRPLALNGATTGHAGRQNEAISLDGADDHPSTQMPDLLSGTVTVSTVCSQDSSSSNDYFHRIIHYRDSSDGFGLTWYSNGAPGFYSIGKNTGAGSITVPAGALAHVVVVWDIGNHVTTYVNGTVDIDRSYTETSAVSTPTFTLGAAPRGGNYTPGDYDETLVYSRGLSASEISALATDRYGL